MVLGHREYSLVHNNLLEMMNDRGVHVESAPTVSLDSLRLPYDVLASLEIGQGLDIHGLWDPRLKLPVYIRILDPATALTKAELSTGVRPAFAHFNLTVPENLSPAVFHLIVVANLQNNRSDLRQYDFE